MKTSLTICLFGTYKDKLPSTTLITSGIAQYGAPYSIYTVHEDVPVGFIQNTTHLRTIEILRRLSNRLKASIRLILRSKEVARADVLLILTPGQTDVLLAYMYKLLFRKKIVYIPQVSVYDLLRTILSEKPSMKPLVRISYFIERLLFKACDLVIFNTKQEVTYHKKILNIPHIKTAVLPLGADDTLFFPTKRRNSVKKSFEVLYYGEYIPAHGAQIVAKAAQILRSHPDIHFTMIGEGMEKDKVIQILKQKKLTNVTVKGWMSPQELADHIRKADVVSGFLGKDPLALRTIPNKVYQSIATGKCVITGKSPVFQDTFIHGKNIYIIPPENHKALAEALLFLKENTQICTSIGENAYSLFQDTFSRKAITHVLINHIKSLY